MKLEMAVGKKLKVGKRRAKLERTERSWKFSFEVGNFFLKLERFLQMESFAAVRKFWLKLES